MRGALSLRLAIHKINLHLRRDKPDANGSTQGTGRTTKFNRQRKVAICIAGDWKGKMERRSKITQFVHVGSKGEQLFCLLINLPQVRPAVEWLLREIRWVRD